MCCAWQKLASERQGDEDTGGERSQQVAPVSARRTRARIFPVFSSGRNRDWRTNSVGELALVLFQGSLFPESLPPAPPPPPMALEQVQAAPAPKSSVMCIRMGVHIPHPASPTGAVIDCKVYVPGAQMRREDQDARMARGGGMEKERCSRVTRRRAGRETESLFLIIYIH